MNTRIIPIGVCCVGFLLVVYLMSGCAGTPKTLNQLDQLNTNELKRELKWAERLKPTYVMWQGQGRRFFKESTFTRDEYVAYIQQRLYASSQTDNTTYKEQPKISVSTSSPQVKAQYDFPDDSNTIWNQLIVETANEQSKRMVAKNKESLIRIKHLGFYIISNENNEFEIPSNGIEPDTKKYGLKSGDIILDVDNIHFKDRKSLMDYLGDKQEGETANIKIKRLGNILYIKELTLKSDYIFSDILMILREIWKGKMINLAIITDVKYINTLLLSDQNRFNNIMANIRKSQQAEILSMFENSFSRLSFVEKGFTLIDRNKTDLILNELKFQSSGLISDESQMKLGRMIGVNRLFFAEVEGDMSPISPRLTLRNKWVDVESGKIIATARYHLDNEMWEKVVDWIVYNDSFFEITRLRKDFIEEYNKINAYTDRYAVYRELTETCIPKLTRVIQNLSMLNPITKELKEIHGICLDGDNKFRDYLLIMANSMKNNDRNKFNEAENVRQKAVYNQDLCKKMYYEFGSNIIK
ncbi:MAG: PDZ domain-containing protein [Deltaproteobacteria bacterium]|nr:PDZ domain-containing protein [Deltaproteobacteria bacterium]